MNLLHDSAEPDDPILVSALLWLIFPGRDEHRDLAQAAPQGAERDDTAIHSGYVDNALKRVIHDSRGASARPRAATISGEVLLARLVLCTLEGW